MIGNHTYFHSKQTGFFRADPEADSAYLILSNSSLGCVLSKTGTRLAKTSERLALHTRWKHNLILSD